jgi:energy-coupling factor transport system permease protein
MEAKDSMIEKKGIKSWTTRDLLVTAVIGIVFSFVLAGAMNLSTVLMATTSPLIGSMLVMPIFALAGVMAPYIVRRQGASILSELIAGLVMIPFTVYGFTVLVGRLTEGILYEGAFFATRYKRWGWLSMMLSPAIAATILFLIGILGMGAVNMPPAMIVVLLACNFVLTALAGAVAKILADTIAKTGVLNSFAIGKEMQEEI